MACSSDHSSLRYPVAQWFSTDGRWWFPLPRAAWQAVRCATRRKIEAIFQIGFLREFTLGDHFRNAFPPYPTSMCWCHSVLNFRRCRNPAARNTRSEAVWTCSRPIESVRTRTSPRRSMRWIWKLSCSTGSRGPRRVRWGNSVARAPLKCQRLVLRKLGNEDAEEFAVKPGAIRAGNRRHRDRGFFQGIPVDRLIQRGFQQTVGVHGGKEKGADIAVSSF